jgi:hypothetical protein
MISILLSTGESDSSNCRRLQEVHRFCTKWAERHESSFNISKYQLLHLSRTRGQLQAAFRTGDTEVKPTKTLKLLGIYLDKTMRGKALVKGYSEQDSGTDSGAQNTVRLSLGCIPIPLPTSLQASNPPCTYLRCSSLVQTRRSLLKEGGGDS